MSTTTLTTKTERTILDDAVLQQFTAAEWPFSEILCCKHYRGDLTQSGDDRLRATMGEEAYSHYHWDTVASDGKTIFLTIPRFKHPTAKQEPRGPSLPAQYFWCLAQIERGEDAIPTPAKVIATRIADDLRTKIEALPELKWWTVKKVHFWSSGRGKQKRKSEPPPANVQFFTCQGGYGLVMMLREDSAPSVPPSVPSASSVVKKTSVVATQEAR